MEHIRVKLSIPSGVTTMVVMGGVRLDRMDRGGEEMESPPRLGLRTINIVPLWKD